MSDDAHDQKKSEELKGLPKPLFLPTPPGEQTPFEEPREEGDTRLPLSRWRSPLRPQPSLKVSHATLRKSAESASDIRGKFHKAAASLETSTKTAHTEFEGWLTAEALETSHKKWEEQAANASEWLGRIAASLREAKKAYKSTDHETELNLRQISPDADPKDTGQPHPNSKPTRSALDGF
ncbi:WXG100 family type VII secretion target [Streptomyces qinglanensis]|uniref:WXG100 family type VII secretion target n=1 Tax=Streptomyces qinglanensis TaxID=943816 RepID=UPI0037AE3FF4